MTPKGPVTPDRRLLRNVLIPVALIEALGFALAFAAKHHLLGN